MRDNDRVDIYPNAPQHAVTLRPADFGGTPVSELAIATEDRLVLTRLCPLAS